MIWKNYLFNAFSTICIGLLLLVYPENTTLWIVRIIGALFLIPGIIQIIGYFSNLYNLKKRTFFPILGIGSSLFGLILIAVPSFFISLLMYILAVFLIIVAGNQILYLRQYRSIITIRRYIIPIIVLLVGIFIFINPIESASIPFILLGYTFIIYGFSEIWNIIYLKHKLKSKQEQIK